MDRGGGPGGREHGQGDGSTGGTLHMDSFTFLHLTVFRHVHILLPTQNIIKT